MSRDPSRTTKPQSPQPRSHELIARDQAMFDRLAHQRAMRLFGSVTKAVMTGDITEAQGEDIVRSSIVAARTALLDKRGESQPDLQAELAAIMAELMLKGEGDPARLAHAASLALNAKSMLEDFGFTGSAFPYSDQASMVATISDVTVKLTAAAAGRIDPMRLGQIVDDICQVSYELAKEMVPGIRTRDVYNFTQSMIKFLGSSVHFPEGKISVEAAQAQIAAARKQYITVMEPMAAKVKAWFAPPEAEQTPAPGVS